MSERVRSTRHGTVMAFVEYADGHGAYEATTIPLPIDDEHADELLAAYAARTALADELVRLIQRIGVLEDGTDDDRRAAIPLHGRVADLCGEYETTYLGGPEARDGE